MEMDMEGGNKENVVDNWSIYRDAFTPTTLSHTTTHKPKPKPWERAPVPAHAPRLAGQKIWKKASSLHPTTALSLAAAADKENAVQADLELENGGMGARKRRRGVPGVGGKAKENIAEARWMVVDAEGMERSVDGGIGAVNASPRKAGGAAGLWDEDAFVVPRKRTNANHLITPRKPLRSIENSVVAAPVLDVGQSPVKAAMSPAKVTKVPLNDGEGAGNADQETEKPRRRRSMRKSRRLTRSDLVEPSTDERRGSFIFGQKGGDDAVESFSGVVAKLQQASTLSEETSPKAEQPNDAQDAAPVHEQAVLTVPVLEASENQETASPEKEADAVETSLPEAVQTEEVEETVQHEACEQVQEQVSFPQLLELTDESASKTEDVPDGVHERVETQSELDTIVEISTTQVVELQTTEVQAVQAAVESSDLHITTTIESSELQTISEQSPQTPLKVIQLQPATLQSTETDMAVVLSPTKAVGTPRSRRKTPQRSATRRSTRTSRSSRASSVAREEPSAQVATVLEAVVAETTVTISTGAETHSVDSVSLHLDSRALHEAEQDKNIVNVDEVAVSQVPSDDQLMDNTAMNEVLQSTETAEACEEVQHEKETNAAEKSVPEISTSEGLEGQEEVERGTSEQEICDEQLREEFEIWTPKRKRGRPVKSLSPTSEPVQGGQFSDEISEESAESFELIEPMSIATSEDVPCSPPDEASEDLPGSSTPDPTTTELTKAISENAPPAVYDHDDTDMLRNFLSKVKANKAAKAKTYVPKRKRSLPHSPLQIPLETVDATSSPGSPKAKDEFDVSLPASPTKRRKRNELTQDAPQEDDATEPRSIRRSGRTRLPVKAAPAALAAPSFIPVRRLGQDGDSTVTLRRNEEKDLAALTKVNTRKNKGGASHPADFLAKKANEKDDPATRQRALKEVFDEKNYKQKLNKKGNTVVWAEELAQFQTEEGKKVVLASLTEKEGGKESKKVTIPEKEPEREKEKAILPGDEKKSVSATSTPKVKVGMRSKMTLGMAANGTPAPKRRVRARS
ncbi:hypothetical protein ONS96_003735 [Cadophora gregata f. sp. sojae]|nr:hypothetical protein ONS96_003735 [Cadophora gregata f. sp. sojae]